MNISAPILLFVSAGTLLGSIVISVPDWVNDSNAFIKNFVGEPLLSALGVILAINLASLAQLHLNFNNIEERRRKRFLIGARAEVRSSARWMILLFIFAIVTISAKPMICPNPYAIAAINCLSMLILLFYILIMWDIVEAIFDLEPEIETNDPHCDGDS
jgi:hypothetical protein